MKTMTCNQLGGACDEQFQAQTFEEMAALSRAHGLKMLEQGDEAHKAAMDKMKEMMTNPMAMQEWMDEKKKEFDELPEEN